MASQGHPADLERLAGLIRTRNQWEREVAAIAGRPALISHLGEFIAARIFNIRLDSSAGHKASDGVFADGPLAGAGVNIRWYSRHESRLDLAPGYPDYYLVLAGPKPTPEDEHALTRAWLVEAVYLFSSARLLDQLKDSPLEIVTLLPPQLWQAAELYPAQRCPDYVLSDDQCAWLKLFGE